MNTRPPRPSAPTVLRRSRTYAGFTLVEVMVASTVASLVAVVTIGIMGEGGRLIRSAASIMLAHSTGSAAIRRVSLDLEQAQANQVRIYPDYLNTVGGGGSFGSCALVNLLDGTSATYYLAPNPGDGTNALFWHRSAVTAPAPATDKVLVTSVQDLEFRRDALGAIRVAFRVATYGYPSMTPGSVEADVVRFSTSTLPRN